MSNKKVTTMYITRTGILLALALIFQLGFQSFAQPIVGPLVNLVLILSAALVGTLSGVVIGCFTPLIASMVGILKLAPMVPFIMIGNSILVILFNLVRKRISKGREYIGLVVAALGKFAFLAFSVRYLVILFMPKVPSQVIAAFSLPQLYTALAGGIVAIIIMKLIPKSFYMNNKGYDE